MVGLEIIEASSVMGPPSGIIWRPNVYAEIVGFVRNTVVVTFVYFVFFVERSVARHKNELCKHTSLAPCTTSLHHFLIDIDEIDIDEYPKAYLMFKIQSDLSLLDQNKML